MLNVNFETAKDYDITSAYAVRGWNTTEGHMRITCPSPSARRRFLLKPATGKLYVYGGSLGDEAFDELAEKSAGLSEKSGLSSTAAEEREELWHNLARNKQIDAYALIPLSNWGHPVSAD